MAEKQAKNFDKVVGEWKVKVGDLGNELQTSQRECRNYNSDSGMGAYSSKNI